jgi:hypothetical protein
MTHRRMSRAAAAVAAVSLASASALALPGTAFAATSSSSSAPTPSTPAPSTAGPSAGSSSPQCTPSTFSQAQQTVETDLAKRVAQLNTLIGRVNGAAGLTPADKATLLADLTKTELPGIQALQSKVPGDTTCAQLRQDAHEMVDDFRVYVVMAPETDLVIANDAPTGALEPAISGWIQYAQAHGKNVSDAQAAFADYQAKVTAAQSLTTAGQSATLLALTPQGYPGNASVILQARTNLANARNDLYAARGDLAKIIHDLS